MYKFGKRSKQRLEGVDSRLIEVLNEAIKLMDLTIIEGLRSEERQQKLLKLGKTKTKYSKHLQGKAVDVAPYPVDWEDRDRFHYMGGMLNAIGHMKGYDIVWGGDWDDDGETKDNNFDDLVHVQIDN